MTVLTHEPVVFSRWSGPRHVMSPPPAELVLDLQAPTAFPAVTLLLPTSAASVMTPQDRVVLRGLLDQARQRLYAGRVPGAEGVVAELARVVEEVMTLPTVAGLAVLTSRDGIRASVRLPVAVVPRVVVDASFANRDLVRALHRTPRHVVLALGSREARLFEGAGNELRPVTGHFPITAARDQRRDPARPGLARADTAAFYRDVDAALGAHLRLHPSPIVLAGSRRRRLQGRFAPPLPAGRSGRGRRGPRAAPRTRSARAPSARGVPAITPGRVAHPPGASHWEPMVQSAAWLRPGSRHATNAPRCSWSRSRWSSRPV